MSKSKVVVGAPICIFTKILMKKAVYTIPTEKVKIQNFQKVNNCC